MDGDFLYANDGDRVAVANAILNGICVLNMKQGSFMSFQTAFQTKQKQIVNGGEMWQK